MSTQPPRDDAPAGEPGRSAGSAHTHPSTVGLLRQRTWARLRERPETRLLAFGLALALAITVALGVGLMLAPAATVPFAAVIGLNLVIGRAAGMSWGYAAGLGHLEVLLCNLVVETAQVLVVYPLFALAWDRLIDTRRLLARTRGRRG